MSVYYNEHDLGAAEWLRQLIISGLIPPGDLDTRSIEDVTPLDVAGYTQCHFFAGIGGWPLALALAGVPESFRVWTGSCPCQPFSNAGKRKGLADERHLWPAFRHLIAECDPPVVFGEQVSSPAGRKWLDAVLTDLEDNGYATGAADLCAAGVGAPHIRQRLYWMGDAGSAGSGRDTGAILGPEGGCVRTVADLSRLTSEDGRMGDADGARSQRWSIERNSAYQRPAWAAGLDNPWRDTRWVSCDDPNGQRWRPTEPGTFPLAHGFPERVGLLRGYGNAIVPQVAATFIKAGLGL